MKKKPTTKTILELMMIESYSEVLRFQKLIDQWNTPKDVVQRSAVLLRDVHQFYGKFAYVIYKNVVKKK